MIASTIDETSILTIVSIGITFAKRLLPSNFRILDSILILGYCVYAQFSMFQMSLIQVLVFPPTFQKPGVSPRCTYLCTRWLTMDWQLSSMYSCLAHCVLGIDSRFTQRLIGTKLQYRWKY